MFEIQGLELDSYWIVCNVEFRYKPGEWGTYPFVGSKWQKIKKEERKMYLKNAYRVLLTRARQGMVIVVPQGNPEDPTRKPEFYDSTYKYLRGLGVGEI